MWSSKAKPKSKVQWKAGRSAMECAVAWIGDGRNPELPAEVAAVLRSSRDFGAVSEWNAEPECIVAIDSYSGPPNIDVLVSARDDLGAFAMVVEAKGDESFGPPISKAFAAAVKRRVTTPESKGVARLEQLVASLLPPDKRDPESTDGLRYQLLTATAAALAHANRLGATRAVVMVHEFQTPLTRSKNLARNSTDLVSYLECFGLSDCDPLFQGQLLGPIHIHPSATHTSPPALYFGKAIRRIDTLPEH